MVKGINKRIVEVNVTENEVFEKAILFVRNESVSEDDAHLNGIWAWRGAAAALSTGCSNTPPQPLPAPPLRALFFSFNHTAHPVGTQWPAAVSGLQAGPLRTLHTGMYNRIEKSRAAVAEGPAFFIGGNRQIWKTCGTQRGGRGRGLVGRSQKCINTV